MSPATPKRGTRKRRATAVSATTIPELKESFDALEREVAAILRAGGDKKQRVRKFQEAWRKIFGRPVEATAAEAYLQVKARAVPKARLGAKTRKAHRGGGAAALAGAPLDFQTRPGVDGVHGSFLPYVTSGLSFYNTVNQQAMFKDCGTQDITPKVAADMGSNKVGGGMFSDVLQAVTTRPITSSSPPSLLQDAQTVLMGKPLGASPAADQPSYKYM